MIVLANLIGAVAHVLDAALVFVLILVFVRALLSWFSPDPFNPLVRFLVSSTDPMLRPLQKKLPLLGGIDWSPLVLMFILIFLRQFLVQTMAHYALMLQAQALSAV